MSKVQAYQALFQDRLETANPLIGLDGQWPILGFLGVLYHAVLAELKRIVDEKIDTPEERRAIVFAAIEAFKAADLPVVDGMTEVSLKAMAAPVLATMLDQALVYADSLV